MDTFAALAHCADEDIDLARAALAIARDEYPELDDAYWLARLDELADYVRLRAVDGPKLLSALNRQLFRVAGFRGNSRNYYDPRNSYLNDVVERRLGIPISLCLLYMEVAQRVGIKLAPVGFPSHFLVALDAPEGCIYIDPFNAGRQLTAANLRQQLTAMAGADAATEALSRATAPVSRREMVARMLRNLKGVHVQAGDWHRAVRVTDHLVALCPEQPTERRDRGRLYDELDAHRAACEDYRAYLDAIPDADDAPAVRARLSSLLPKAGRLN